MQDMCVTEQTPQCSMTLSHTHCVAFPEHICACYCIVRMLDKTRRSYIGIVVVAPVCNGFTLANTLAIHCTQENRA